MKRYGFEIEIADVSLFPLANIVNTYRLRIFNDRSVRFGGAMVGNRALVPATRQIDLALPDQFYIRDEGVELITKPLTEHAARAFCRAMASELSHLPFKPEASIHIHVSVRNRPWIHVYKTLLLFYAYEQGLYHLAAAGGIHRGEHRVRVDGGRRTIYNDYRYCRPISAPIGIHTTDGEITTVEPLVNISALIHEVQTASDMYRAWGHLHIFNGHYVPHRLMGINLQSVKRQGTLEWRIFDARYQYLPHFFEMVRHIHDIVDSFSIPHLRQLCVAGYPMASIGYKRMQKDVMYDILPKDIVDVLWQEPILLNGVKDKYRLHHYSSDFLVDTSVYTSPIWNNVGEVDNGSVDFILYKED